MSGTLDIETLEKDVGAADVIWTKHLPDIDATSDSPPSAKGGWRALVQDAANIVTEKLPPVVEIVSGIVAECSKLIIGSGSKSFKTWLTMDLGLSIAHGVPVLNRQTERRRVLYANLELKSVTFARRLQVIAKAKPLTIDPEWFFHLPLRGKIGCMSPALVIPQLIGLATDLKAQVIVLDPIYKLNTIGDENSSRDQTILFNELDRLTTDAQCTVILNDHFGKGNQSEKDPLDAIRGSSAKGGDVDAALVLRKHEVADCFRVDMVHRELPPVEPFCIGWKFPLMELRPDLNPDAMKKARAGRKPTHDSMKLLAAIQKRTAKKPVSVSAWSKLANVNRTSLNEYLPGFRAKGWIATVGDGNSARQYITDKGREALLNHAKGNA